MLLALLVMASGLVVAGVTAPSGAGATRAVVVSNSTNSWTSGPRAYATRSRSTGPLLLLLPATPPHPYDYRGLLAAATEAGYHVLAPVDSDPERLQPALTRLVSDDPAGGWGRYVDDRGLRWDEVVLAGHAEGAAEAAAIAHVHRVRSLLLLGNDTSVLAGRPPLPHTRVRLFDDLGLVGSPGASGDSGEQTDAWQRELTRLL